MDVTSYLNNKLSKLLFVEIKEGAKLGDYKIEKSIYLPVRGEQIIEEVKQGEEFKKIPLTYFVEGMFYVMGADKTFKFNDEYKEILKYVSESIKYIKNKIFNEVNNESYEDAYILLKGLITIEENADNYEKILLIVDKLRNENEIYKDEELRIIERAKSFEKLAQPYLYEALIQRDDKDFIKALYSLNVYLQKGGKETSEITEFKQNLVNINNYDKAKELSIEDPKAALEMLIPLLDIFGDSAEVYYYIAVAYRNFGNYEKAIYYLNEAAGIDDALIEVINEYGINYASLGDFDRAVQYFRKAFEATKSVEICTNIIMCYLNLGKIKEAQNHMELAVKLDPHDEIVIELQKMFENNDQ